VSCLAPDDELLRRIVDGRRRGTLTLRQLDDLVEALRRRGHSTDEISRAAGFACCTRVALERHAMH
jgi:hypothetical protein